MKSAASSLGAWCLVGAVLTAAAGCGERDGGPVRPPLRIVVMDPLALPLACECVEGYAQRDYGALGKFLEKKTHRPVEIAFAESLAAVLRQNEAKVHLIIGKKSLVEADAAEAGIAVRPVAMLTDKEGRIHLQGLFVVRSDDPARRIGDLKGRRITFGPADEAEKHGAALRALVADGVAAPKEIHVSPGCNIAALAVIERDVDAGVISSYALALLEGCNTIDKGALRIIGRTEPVPFVTAFFTDALGPSEQKALSAALAQVGDAKGMFEAMETRDGFIPLTPADPAAWTDWRGPGRKGLSGHVPSAPMPEMKLLWKRELENVALSGIAATSKHVIVADKSGNGERDEWLLLDADTGLTLSSMSYDAPGEMDYTNSPRATPVIADGLVYVMGAFGDLWCLTLTKWRPVWHKNIVKAFDAELPTWGMCSTPLVVDEKLIVNPGAKHASLVALDRLTGEVVWTSPGQPAGYSSFIVGTFGGVRQIVGYDAVSLGGWDPATGRRLWTLVPPEEGDFNVGTPVDVGGKLLVATENNGTRLYNFDGAGRIRPEPVAVNDELVPDSSTPVVLNDLVFGNSNALVCLDLKDGLKTLWKVEDEHFEDYASFIAGNGHVLVTTITGEVLLVEANRERPVLKSRLKPFGDDAEVWSHTALVGDRLYLRSQNSVVCVEIR